MTKTNTVGKKSETYLNDHLTVGRILVAKRGPRVIILAGRAQERPVAEALVRPPQIRADALIAARIGIALILPMAALLRVGLHNARRAQPVVPHVLLRHADFVDGDVPHAADELRDVLGEQARAGLIQAAAEEGLLKGGLIGRVGINRMDGLQPVVEPDSKVGYVDGHVHLLPCGVVEVLPDEDPLEGVEHAGVKVEPALVQLQGEEGLTLADGHQAVGQRRLEAQRQFESLAAVRRDRDEGLALEGEGGRDLAHVAVEAGAAGAVAAVVGLAEEPGRAGAAVQAGHLLAPDQRHRAVLPAVAVAARAPVVSDHVCK